MPRHPAGGGTRNAGTGAQRLHSRDDRPAVQRRGRNLRREPGRGAGRFRRGFGRARGRACCRGCPFAAAGLYRHDVGPLVAHNVVGHEGPVSSNASEAVRRSTAIRAMPFRSPRCGPSQVVPYGFLRASGFRRGVTISTSAPPSVLSRRMPCPMPSGLP